MVAVGFRGFVQGLWVVRSVNGPPWPCASSSVMTVELYVRFCVQIMVEVRTSERRVVFQPCCPVP